MCVKLSILTSIILLVSLQKVVGSVYGVRLILDVFPEIGRGPRLNVDIAQGALTEGFLTFAIVFISLNLTKKVTDSFFMKTWISSLSKVTLHMLGSDLTGGCMNPASVSIALLSVLFLDLHLWNGCNEKTICSRLWDGLLQTGNTSPRSI